MFSFLGICSFYIFSYNLKKYLKLKKKTLQFKINTIKISNCFANVSTTYFVNKFGAGFMAQARFQTEVLLHGYFIVQN